MTTWLWLKGDGFLELRQKDRADLCGYLYSVKGKPVAQKVSVRRGLKSVRWFYGKDRAEVAAMLLASVRVPECDRPGLLEEVASCP